MSIDGYSACPCHIEKKIKFCCGKDVLHDLNDAVEKGRSGQVVAAVDQLDRAIGKLGPRDCLVTMKTHLLLNSGKLEEAKETNREFLERNPDNFMGRQLQALICSAEGDLDGAIVALQDALDILDQSDVDSLPVSLAAALKVIGIMLLGKENPFGARQYLLMATQLKDDQDAEILRWLSYTMRGETIEPYLRGDIGIDLLETDDRDWVRSYNNAVKLIRRGQFRLANRLLKKLDEIAPDQLEIIRGLVLTHFCLDQVDQAVEQLHRAARLDGAPREAAIEAEVLAQHFDEKTLEKINSVTLAFELNDVARAFELLDANDKSYLLPPEYAHVLGEGAPPKHAISWLDRPCTAMPEDGEFHIDDFAEATATVAMYGKRTDRPALLVVLGYDTPEFRKSLDEIRDLLADVIEATPSTKSENPALTREEYLMGIRIVPPKGARSLPFDRVAVQRHMMRTRLLDAPLKIFSDKSAREFAASMPADERIRMDGWIFRVGLSKFGLETNIDLIEEIYRELNLDMPPTIPEDRVEAALSSPVQVRMLEFGKLSDKLLLTVYQFTEITGDYILGKKCLLELSTRDSELAQQYRSFVLSLLAQRSENGEEALRLIQEARKIEQAQGRPIGMLLVVELELRLTFGMVDGLRDLLQLIVTRHIEEPDVAEALMGVFQSHGIDPNQLIEGDAAPATRSTATAGSPQSATEGSTPGIWTPDQPAAADQTSTGSDEKKSALWIPGQD